MRLPLICLILHLGLAESAWWNPLSFSEHEFDEVGADAVVGHQQQRIPFELGENSPGDRGLQLLEELKTKLGSSCWHTGYVSLASSCREVLRDDEKKMRLAYLFTDCFLKSSGKKPLKPCPESGPVKECTRVLDDHRSSILVQFYIDIASICHHLQSEAFKLETEEAVAKLQSSTHWLENRISAMQERAKTILDNTEKIFGSQERLEKEYHRVEQKVAGMHEDISEGISHLKAYREEANEHMEKERVFQRDMASEHEKFREQSKNLREEVSGLKTKADDISGSVMKSLRSQEKLLARQDEAMRRLDSLHKLQDELILQGETLYEYQERFVRSFEEIVSVQEGFASKQSSVVTSLDRLFALHDAVLAESRTVKALLFYAAVGVMIYFLTGTKQTSNAREVLYVGICLAFGVEFWSLRLISFTPLYNYVVFRNSLWIRGTYSIAALCYIFYCLRSFKDYECLSYKLLRDMVRMQRKMAKEQIFLSPVSCMEEMEPESDVEIEDDYCNESNVPCFKSYENELDMKRLDGKDLDPDYYPEEELVSDCSQKDLESECFQDSECFQKKFSNSYNFRSKARRSGRRLPRSAEILKWETEEMFSSLFGSAYPR